jgi:hypothetical protein
MYMKQNHNFIKLVTVVRLKVLAVVVMKISFVLDAPPCRLHVLKHHRIRKRR